MDIENILRKEHSKANTNAIVEEACGNPKKMEELLAVFTKGEMRLTQRAAWPLAYLAEKNPDIVKPYLPLIISFLDKPFHIAVKRNVMRMLQDVDLPIELLGPVADKCFEYLLDKKEAIAVQAFSMKVLYNICQKEPELKNELIPILEDMIPYGSAGIKNRASKILKLLYKLQSSR